MSTEVEQQERRGWYVARSLSTYGISRWHVVQNYTARYLNRSGEWDKPMFAMCFSNRDAAIEFGTEKLGVATTKGNDPQ